MLTGCSRHSLPLILGPLQTHSLPDGNEGPLLPEIPMTKVWTRAEGPQPCPDCLLTLLSCSRARSCTFVESITVFWEEKMRAAKVGVVSKGVCISALCLKDVSVIFPSCQVCSSVRSSSENQVVLWHCSRPHRCCATVLPVGCG